MFITIVFFVFSYNKDLFQNFKRSKPKNRKVRCSSKFQLLLYLVLPVWTVKASMNCSFQDEAPIIMDAFPRCIIRSTELWCGRVKSLQKKVFQFSKGTVIAAALSNRRHFLMRLDAVQILINDYFIDQDFYFYFDEILASKNWQDIFRRQ